MGAWWSKENYEGSDGADGAEEDEEEDAVYMETQVSYQLVQTEIALRRAPHGSFAIVLARQKRSLAGSLIAQENAEVQEADIAAQLLFKEHIFETQDRREVDRMLSTLRKYALKNTDLAGNAMCFPDFFKDFRDLLASFSKGKRNNERRQDLLLKFQHAESSPRTVLLIRLITSIEIHMRRTAYPEDVLGRKYNSLMEFCTGEVFPIGNKHVHADILSNALRVPIRVVDLTQTAPGPPSSSLRSDPAAATASSSDTSTSTTARKRATAPFEITLLYRPGNCYDILYPIPDKVTFCGLGEIFCLNPFHNSS